MACFRQTKKIYEEGTGWITLEFIISDSYENLFTQTGVLDVDIFKFQSTKKDLEENGAQKEDELSFEMDEAKIQTTDEQNCRDFVLTAETTDIWVALFVFETQPYTPGDANYLNFSGRIRSDISGTNLFSSGSQWDTNPNPTREWKLSAQNIGSAILEIDLEDKVVDGILVKGLFQELEEDSAWINDNVTSMPAFKTEFYGSQITHSTVYLVNFNIIFEKLRQNIESRIRSYIPSFQLTFKSSLSGFYFIPSIAKLSTGNSQYFKGWGSNPDEKTKLALFDTTANDNVPILNANLFFPGISSTSEEEKKQKRQLEKDYSFLRYKTFKELIYSLAPCFGNFCQIRNLSATHIQVEFVPLNSLAQSQVYFCDYLSGDLNLQTEVLDEQKYKGRANHSAVEGFDVYEYSRNSNNNWVIKPSEKLEKSYDEKGKLLPITISPTTFTASRCSIDNLLYHHNHSSNKDLVFGPWFIHTAIYIWHKPSIYSYYVATPACQVATKIDNDELIFDSMAGILNAIDSRNGKLHFIEYKRVLPWISKISKSPDGANQSWKNLNIGDLYIEDGKSYTIVGIEYNWEKFETVIRLTRSSKFGFTEPTQQISIIESPDQKTFLESSGLAGDNIPSGAAVIKESDGKYYKMKSVAEHYGKFAGISLFNADIDDEVYIGESYITGYDYNFTPGKLIYVRTNDNGINLSHEALIEPTETENLLLCIGKAISENEFEINKLIESIAK